MDEDKALRLEAAQFALLLVISRYEREQMRNDDEAGIAAAALEELGFIKAVEIYETSTLWKMTQRGLDYLAVSDFRQ